MNIKFCIDQGHYPNANKGIADGYYEGNKMYTLGVYLKEELEKYEGFSAILTRPQITDNPSLEARGRMAIENNCPVFVSLHTNAFSNSTACGVSVFYSLKRPDSRTLAIRLGQGVAERMEKGDGVTYFRGASTRTYPGTTDTDYYAVIRNAVRGSVVKYAYILEQGFHTNPKEAAWLNQDGNLRALAVKEAALFAAYFNVSLKDSSQPPESPAETYITYTVQPGDTLVSIARRYGVTYAALAKLNDIENPSRIVVGQRLRIPVVSSVPPSTTVFSLGEKVAIRSGVTTFANGTSMASWVCRATLYVRQIEGNIILVSTEPVKNVYTGRVYAKDLVKA